MTVFHLTIFEVFVLPEATMDLSHKCLADMILLNGKILTVDEKNTVAEAVAIKDGKILTVGSTSEVSTMAGDETSVINLDGRTVTPGLIDAHIHLDCLSAHTKIAASCHIPPVRYVETSGAVTSRDDILNVINEKVRYTPKGEWIIGQGRIDLEFNGHCPTKQQLDDIAPNHPVLIRFNCHTHLLNEKALDVSGITKNSPGQEELEKVAPGARIIRDANTGEPTGRVIECIDWIFRSGIPWSYDELKSAIEKTCREAVRFGITSIQEFSSWPESVRIYQELYRNGDLPLRVQICPSVWGLYKTVDLDSLIGLGIQTGFGNEWLKFGRIKIFVDVDGYDEKGNWKEWPRISPEVLNGYVMKAHRAGLGVMMHATSREAQGMAMDAVETAVSECSQADHRSRIEHFGGDYWPEGIRRLRKLGIIPVPTPYSPLGWFGDQWLSEAKPGDKAVIYRTLLDEGFFPPGNSDGTGTDPESLNPWWSIWCAVTRKTRNGQLICPEERITVMEAIRLYTNYAAYAGFEENIKGAIEPGKLADLAVLSEDPLTTPLDEFPEIESEMTIVGGQIAYCK